jgi:hypothetical protein
MYAPTTAPSDSRTLHDWAMRELMEVSRYLSGPVDYVRLNVLHAEPAQVFEGLTVYADGTDWNPGAGAGVYVYTTAWTKL